MALLAVLLLLVPMLSEGAAAAAAQIPPLADRLNRTCRPGWQQFGMNQLDIAGIKAFVLKRLTPTSRTGWAPC